VQCFGSGSGLDRDSIRSVLSVSEFQIRIWIQEGRNDRQNVLFLRAEGFFYRLDVLYGGLRMGKLQFLIKKILNFFSAVNIFLIFDHKKPWIRIGIQLKMLDPDPD
jgi:hypothetical protein